MAKAGSKANEKLYKFIVWKYVVGKWSKKNKNLSSGYMNGKNLSAAF